MPIDSTALAFGFVGFFAGVGAYFWQRKNELEERCQFLKEMGADLHVAFDTAGVLLDDRRTPKPIREAIVFLLAAHADSERGKAFAKSFMDLRGSEGQRPPTGDDPISQSMAVLGREHPLVARQAHHVLASLSFGLVFLNLADSIKVERVKNEAARDPVSLWDRIAGMFWPGEGPRNGPRHFIPA